MLKSLYSGISGMKGFQTKLDVIGNNIANVNTVGFKKGRVMFQDIINQNLSGATSPTAQSGGINPKQVGLGSQIGAIDTIHTPGSPMTTGVGTDLSIDGDAFFVLKPTSGTGPSYLTKAGNFTRDGYGNVVNSSGYFVTGVAERVEAPVNPGDDPVVTQYQLPINISEVSSFIDDGAGGTIEETAKITSYSIDANGFIDIVVEDGRSGKLAYDFDNNAYYLNENDGPENISLATTVVANPGGLKKVGGTLFEVTENSGFADFGRITENQGGQINSAMLEMSNVDLTEEFTELIVAQRGFQANARTITTSDSILEEVVNLKR